MTKTQFLPQELLDLIFEFLEKDLCMFQEYGFQTALSSQKYLLFQKEKNQKNFKIWKSLLEKGLLKNPPKLDENLRKLIYSGIPPKLRGILWPYFLEISKHKKKSYREFFPEKLENKYIEIVFKKYSHKGPQ
jgi:hypothetical protein